MTSHILACLAPFTEFIFIIVLNMLIIDSFLELIHAIKVNNRVFFFIVLAQIITTLLERRGLPRVLSVFGLISCPGALMNISLLFLHASAWHEWRELDRTGTIFHKDIRIYALPLICSLLRALCFDRFIIRSLQL